MSIDFFRKKVIRGHWLFGGLVIEKMTFEITISRFQEKEHVLRIQIIIYLLIIGYSEN